VNDGSILFLLDDSALPLCNNYILAPLPSRFYSLDGNIKMGSYIKDLQSDENIKAPT